MKSLLNMKRLPGILAVGLVSLAVGAAGASATAPPTATSSGATVSGLTKKQSKAKKKALKKCNKKKARSKKATSKKRKHCKSAVNKKYKKIAKRNKPTTPPIGKTWTVDLGDNYFAPEEVDLKVNDAINWSWANIGGYEPHNVTLDTGPSGVPRTSFMSPTSAVPSTTFKRQFIKPGTYNFVCTLHFGMTMSVKVSK